MLFSSATFLLLFLPPAVGGYYLCPRFARNVWLLAVSLAFYRFSDPGFFWIFLCGIAWNWLLGLAVGGAGARLRKACLLLGVTGDLLLLGVYKYGAFLAGTAARFLPLPFRMPQLLLPVGLSFFTFQEISYLADVYRGERPQKNPLLLGLYVAFFPQLIAGPIVRWRMIRDQIESRRETLADFTDGFYRFSAGLIKKVLIADPLGQMADAILREGAPAGAHAPLLLLAVLAFALQLYLDFSGYSDMAIGLGRMFGFRLPENFRTPYRAATGAEFWQRWHVSLHDWFRDYVYLPLGGSRGPGWKTARNLLAVWLLTGMWHGASWPCILWGVLWGLLLLLERFLIRPGKRGRAFRRAYAAAIPLLAGVLFILLRIPTVGGVLRALSVVFSRAGWRASALPALRLWLHDEWLFLVAALLVAAGLPEAAERRLSALPKGDPRRARARIFGACALILGLALAFSRIAGDAYNPFLYFQF